MRSADDYGHHLNADGKAICRLCRLDYAAAPYNQIGRRRPWHNKAAYVRCPFCARIAAILAEMEALGVQPGAMIGGADQPRPNSFRRFPPNRPGVAGNEKSILREGKFGG